MTTPPTPQALLSLYTSMLRTSRSFSSYNFRTYFERRTKTLFRDIQKEQDPVKLSTFYADAVKELAVLRRSVVVNQLYGGSKLAVEAEVEVQKAKGD